MIHVRRCSVHLLGAIVALAGLSAVAPVASAAPRYRPPVAGSVTDHFRPPSNPYGSGNRGIDYQTDVGVAVTASRAGRVSFAGQVGGDLFVVIAHDDGLRTTYAYLASVEVAAGSSVGASSRIGTSGGHVHFGVRLGDRYLDPERLLAGELGRARLIPVR
jgi:murein DD-endopeptidase MepM/ murein hydrolase activator NlpD